MLHYQNHHQGGGKMSINYKEIQGVNFDFDPNTFQFEEGEGLREEDLPANHINDICKSDLSDDS